MIQTVLGEIPASEIGFTLPHEHLLIDLRPLVPAPTDEGKQAMFRQDLCLANLGYTLNNPYAVLDNAVIDDYAVVTHELLEFKRAGGVSLVDATLREIGRQPRLLESLSQETGVNIVAGCGYYTADSHPEHLAAMSVGDVAGEMVAELTKGMDGTSIKAGVIGEIGTSATITDAEWKCVHAAALAHGQTGAGIHVHTSLWDENGLEIVRRLAEWGVPPEKICIDHIDVDLRYDYLVALCEAGAIVEFDNFGKEYYVNKRQRYFMLGRFAYDLERAETISRLIADGYSRHILITNDICLKSLLHSYGGRGYDHILTNVLPMMEDLGIAESDINTLCVHNPAAFLDL